MGHALPAGGLLLCERAGRPTGPQQCRFVDERDTGERTNDECAQSPPNLTTGDRSWRRPKPGFGHSTCCVCDLCKVDGALDPPMGLHAAGKRGQRREMLLPLPSAAAMVHAHAAARPRPRFARDRLLAWGVA